MKRLSCCLRAAGLFVVATGLLHATHGYCASIDRMYVLQCGESRTNDVSANWSPGVDVGVARDFSDNCYLIRHAERWFLWDSGMSDGIAAKPDGVVAANGLLTMWVRTTLTSQLQALGVAPTDVTDIAFSHFHSDHVGNANLFTSATLYIQEAEYDAAFGPNAAKFNFNSALYEKLRGNPVKKLHGDYDVFGDGSVMIIATPGHTPGHQSLLVRLATRGPVVLSGDMVHFQENWEHRRIPLRNFDQAESKQSMEKVAELLTRERAELWINHDKAQSAAIPKAPAAIQ